MNTANSIEHCIVCWGRGACLVMLPWARRAEGNAAGTTAVVAFRVSKQLICSISNVAISKKKKIAPEEQGVLVWGNAWVQMA